MVPGALGGGQSAGGIERVVVARLLKDSRAGLCRHRSSASAVHLGSSRRWVTPDGDAVSVAGDHRMATDDAVRAGCLQDASCYGYAARGGRCSAVRHRRGGVTSPSHAPHPIELHRRGWPDIASERHENLRMPWHRALSRVPGGQPPQDPSEVENDPHREDRQPKDCPAGEQPDVRRRPSVVKRRATCRILHCVSP